MNVQNIGETSGLVWKYLQTNGKTTLSKLEKSVDTTPDQVRMAIGWLAREGKIELAQEKRSITIWLVECIF